METTRKGETEMKTAVLANRESPVVQYRPSFSRHFSLLGGDMQRIDGYYLYSVGAALHPLSTIRYDTKFQDAFLPCFVAEGALEPFLFRSVFKLKTSLQKGGELLAAIKTLREAAGIAIGKEEEKEKQIEWLRAYNVSNGITQFETVLAAELGLSDIYLVSKKRGYDTSDLITNGIVLFPSELVPKVPEAELDINQGARCLAFELPTAAGFHFHRANESVLHKYYDAVTKGKPRPAGRNIGDYLGALKSHRAGEPAVLSALKDLKDLHRNPLIHPEHTLEDVDEAIALLGSIHAVVVRMLKAIPLPATPAQAAPAAP